MSDDRALFWPLGFQTSCLISWISWLYLQDFLLCHNISIRMHLHFQEFWWLFCTNNMNSWLTPHIQDKEINESIQQPRSSNLRIVYILFNGTILDFKVRNLIATFPHLETDLKYTTAGKADIDTSENWCK